jgi:hypothetical protein
VSRDENAENDQRQAQKIINESKYTKYENQGEDNCYSDSIYKQTGISQS